MGKHGSLQLDERQAHPRFHRIGPARLAWSG
jgi:hypothetical protein